VKRSPLPRSVLFGRRVVVGLLVVSILVGAVAVVALLLLGVPFLLEALS
jgi:hypothetical protein